MVVIDEARELADVVDVIGEGVSFVSASSRADETLAQAPSRRDQRMYACPFSFYALPASLESAVAVVTGPLTHVVAKTVEAGAGEGVVVISFTLVTMPCVAL